MSLALAFLLATVPAIAQVHPASQQVHPASEQSALLLSDVHLNPFPSSQQCQAVTARQSFAKLAAEPASQWSPQDFSFEPGPNSYGEDTNEALFESALNAMQLAVPRPSVIFVPGDFLAHNFRGLWQACQPASLQGVAADAAYRDFTAKTIEFVLLRLNARFPGTQIVPVLGNNDSDRGDYGVPSAEWLRSLASALPPITGLGARAADWSHFVTGGYYSTGLRNFPGVEVLALNSVLWSPKCKSEAGADCISDGAAELAWIESHLKAARALGKSVVVTGHVPPGINGFDTLHRDDGSVVMMYDDCGEAGAATGCVDFGHKLPALLTEYSDVVRVGIFGHTHMNEFRVAGNRQQSVPVQVVPAISPIYGNNPAFLVAQVSPRFSIANYQAWRLAIGQAPALAKWGEEYDFGQTYGPGGLTGTHLLQTSSQLTKDPQLRRKYFLYLGSESARIVAPPAMQSEYLCILTNLTPESALACVMPEMGFP